MEPIFRMTAWQPIPRRRIPKTHEMLEEEIAQKTTERKILTDKVGPFLFAEFDSMKPPKLVGPLTRTNIVEHVKSISESLGGRPFIKGVEIMVSENNMGLLDSLLSTELPEWKANRSYEQSTKRKDPGPNAGPNAGQKVGQKVGQRAGPNAGQKTKKAKTSHQPKHGGAHRTRRRHKKQTCRR